MNKRVPIRSKVDKKYTWNAESVFPSEKAWEKEIQKIIEAIPAVKAY